MYTPRQLNHFEYGARRKPQVIGPFFDYGTATHWLVTQPDALECKRLKYRRPHSNPRDFIRATIRPMTSY